MMTGWQEAFAWAIPTAAAVGGILALLSDRPVVARWAGPASSLVALAAALSLLAFAPLPFTVSLPWAPQIGLAPWLRVDVATLALAVLVSGIGALVLQYAGAYFGDTDKGRRASGTLMVFQAAMLGLVLSDDLLLLFVFWELTGVCSFFLIKTDADKRDDAFPAARRALLVTGGGALPMLVGFLWLAHEAGTTRLSELVSADLPVSVQSIVFLLIVLGVVSKSAQVPLHFWLPGAMAAPTPISAYLHSATMVKAGVILLLFLFPVLGDSPLWTTVLVPLGAITCVWGAYQALTHDDAKQLMAWSTVSQLGLLTLTIGLGSDLAVRAAVLHLFAHAVFKAGLFLTVGAVDHSAHTRKLSELGGLGKRAKLLFAVAMVLGGSMMGMPPFAGFLSKELILEKAMLANPMVHGIAIAGIALGSVGTVAYTLRFVLRAFTGEPRSRAAREAHAPAWAFVASPAVLAAITLVAGLGAPYTDAWFLEPVSAALVGVEIPAPGLALWHGLTPALLWSVGIVSTGVLLMVFMRGRALRDVVSAESERGFEAFMGAAQRAGATAATLLGGLNPNVYFATVLVLGLGSGLLLAPWLGAVPLAMSWGGAVVLGLLFAQVATLLVLRGRLTRAVVLGLVGATVAVLFRMVSAPDLMLTQLLVELLMTVFLALSLRLLIRHPVQERQSIGIRASRVGVSLVAGGAAASVAAALLLSPRDGRLLAFYGEAGPQIAQGTNLVNVILVDFRSLDTLVETIVVVLAALGVAGLLKRREVPPVSAEDAR